MDVHVPPDDCLLYFHKHIPDAWRVAQGIISQQSTCVIHTIQTQDKACNGIV